MSENEPKLQIGPYLKAARRKAGYNQEDVAPLLGYEGKSGVSALERGENIPTATVLNKMADLYGVSADYLLGREDKMRPSFQGVTKEHTDFLKDLAQLPEDAQGQIMELVRSLRGPLRGAKMVADLLSMDPRGISYDAWIEHIERVQAEYRQPTRK